MYVFKKLKNDTNTLITLELLKYLLMTVRTLMMTHVWLGLYLEKNKNKIIKQNQDTNTDPTTNNIDTLDLESIKELVRTEMKNMTDSSQTQGQQRQPYTNYHQYNNNSQYKQNTGHYQNRYNRPYNTNKGCYNCGDSTHYKRDCPKLSRSNTVQTNSSHNNQALN